MLWISLIAALVIGVFTGGVRSLRLARQGELQRANRLLRRSAYIAACAGMLRTVPTLGWPFKEISVSVPEEITRTVIQTVQVPIEVTKWLVWTTTELESRQVSTQIKDTVFHKGAAQEFSFWLLLAMLGVGWLCFLLEKKTVQLLWRWFG